MALLKDTLKFEGYENMTAEQKVAAWEAANAPEIDMSRYVDKSLYDSKVSDLAAKNKRVKELETSQLSAEDKLKQDRADFEAEKAKFARERNADKIKVIFAKNGLKDEDFADLDIDGYEDSAKAEKFANTIVKMMQSQRSAAESDARSSLLGGKAPESGVTPDQATKMRSDYKAALEKGDTFSMTMIALEAQKKGVSL